uniref:Uncharacterized protein n=1 Tax=Bracon brevicornis TaxID=1563983 RepID=A0A6V7K531_9HYME
MPGEPINQKNPQEIDNADGINDNNGVLANNTPAVNNTVVRELTQTDKLNKKLLESVLERMSKNGEFDKFMDNHEVDEDKGEF